MLELQGLTRRYGDLVALDDLSFTVAEGQMFGFVGPNGAGKTTAMRIMSPGCSDTWAHPPLTPSGDASFALTTKSRRKDASP